MTRAHHARALAMEAILFDFDAPAAQQWLDQVVAMPEDTQGREALLAHAEFQVHLAHGRVAA